MGANIAWKIYANDSSNNWNWTDIYSFQTISSIPQIWNLAVRNNTGYKIDQIPSGHTIIISVNVSGSINYIQGNFTWPNGTVVLQNLTLNETSDHNYNWTYWLPTNMPAGTAQINVTAYNIYGLANSTNTTLEILEYFEVVLNNNPVNFSSVYPNNIVNATPGNGWPLLAITQGNVNINLTQYGDPYLTGLVDNKEKILISNITWNSTNITSYFSQLTETEIVVNDSIPNGTWQQPIYYRFNVPQVNPQKYGGMIYIKSKKSLT
jgi:hypothetical protein